MPCYHPLTAYAYRSKVTHKYSKPIFHPPDISAEFKAKANGTPYEKLKLPCGQCIGCRLEYSRQWAVRCMLEAQKSKHNAFITLTYNNENIVYGGLDRPTLVPHHLKKFMHDLRQFFKRKYDEDNIRFFACGEYGSEENTARPHFHIILFNCNIRDKKFLKCTPRGDVLYTSDIISSIWKKGFITIGEVNFRTASYTARYMMKKHKGLDKSYYDDLCIAPEFSRTSLKPGIARDYFDENSGKVYDVDKVYILGANGNTLKIPPPRYFDKLYENIDIEHLEKLKIKRQDVAQQKMYFKLKETDVSEEEYLYIEEGTKLCKIRSLQREI